MSSSVGISADLHLLEQVIRFPEQYRVIDGLQWFSAIVKGNDLFEDHRLHLMPYSLS